MMTSIEIRRLSSILSNLPGQIGGTAAFDTKAAITEKSKREEEQSSEEYVESDSLNSSQVNLIEERKMEK